MPQWRNWIAHRISNPGVWGSNPCWGAINIFERKIYFMTDHRRKYYERAFQALCDANLLFDNIRKCVTNEISDINDDPATTAIDIGFDYLIYLYVEEAFSIIDVWDSLFEGICDFLCNYKWENNKFSLDKLDEIIVQCLEETANEEYAIIL